VKTESPLGRSYWKPVIVTGWIVLAVSLFAIGYFAYNMKHEPVSSNSARWGEFGSYIGGVLGPLIAALNIAFFVSISLFLRGREESFLVLQERNAAVSRTIDLHLHFYSSDFYERIRHVAYKVNLKWRLLSTTDRVEFRRIVASGWAWEDDDESKLDIYVYDRKEILNCKNEKRHFSNTTPQEGLTEHQAISIYLRFWGRVSRLYQLGLLDEAVLNSMFSDLFSYEKIFFCELSKSVSEALINAGGKSPPSWIKDIETLGEFFAKNAATGKV
jgi:hypothetical protein